MPICIYNMACLVIWGEIFTIFHHLHSTPTGNESRVQSFCDGRRQFLDCLCIQSTVSAYMYTTKQVGTVHCTFYPPVRSTRECLLMCITHYDVYATVCRARICDRKLSHSAECTKRYEHFSRRTLVLDTVIRWASFFATFCRMHRHSIHVETRKNQMIKSLQ
jgi:hypothetical protein